MTLELQERFDLLVASGQVSAVAAQAAGGILAGVAAYLRRPLDAEAGAMIATHLAFALERLLQAEDLAALPAEALEEARSYPDEWAAAERLLAKAADALGCQVPPGEVIYLTFHLRTLREQG